MSDASTPLGSLFPVGGPVPPPLVIGRAGDVQAISGAVRDGIGTFVAGARRIGKTTVCDAVCALLADDGWVVIKVDVPESDGSGAFLQQVIRASATASGGGVGRKLASIVRPLVEQTLKDQGLPLDLSGLSTQQRLDSARDILGLPLAIARRKGKVVLFFDELQRIVDYDDGPQMSAHLLDVLAGVADVVVLADGSDERTFAQLLGPPFHLGKLLQRHDLPPTIPSREWGPALTARFAAAGLKLPQPQLERLVAWGDGQPFRTMAAALNTATTARRTGLPTVDDFDVQMGIDAAGKRLNDDGA